MLSGARGGTGGTSGRRARDRSWISAMLIGGLSASNAHDGVGSVARHPQSPSPLVGEGGGERSEPTGEGSVSAETDPSPGSELRSKPPSPTRGEGTPRKLRW